MTAEPYPMESLIAESAPTVTTRLTEDGLFAQLRQKFAKPGNGGAGEYAILRHVRNAAGFGASRTFDAVAVSLWPSRGFTLHCFEIKCSRSDWLRELKEPAKAEAAAQCCDRFSIVAADSSIIRSGELPPTWGLLVSNGASLRTVVAAPPLPGSDPARPVSRDFLVPLLRSAGAVAATPAEVRQARVDGMAEGRKLEQVAHRSREGEFDELVKRVREFEEAAGVPLRGWASTRTPTEVGRALRTVLESETVATKARARLTATRNALASALETIDAVLDEAAS